MCVCLCLRATVGRRGKGRTKITTRTRWVNPWKLLQLLPLLPCCYCYYTRVYKRAYSVYRSYLCYSSQGHVRCSQYFRRSDDDFIPFAARTRAHTTHIHTHAGKSVRVCRCVRTPCILFWFHCVPAHEVSIWLGYGSLALFLSISLSACLLCRIYIYIW